MDEIASEMLRKMAQQAGLDLNDGELQRLLPAVNRAKKQAAELRDLIAASDEPAAAFMASNTRRK